MGNRLTKVYTRTGDDGKTGLADGTRVEKVDPRVEAIGAVDEANSALGVVLSEKAIPLEIRECLTRIQHELFEVGAELSQPGMSRIGSSHVERLEAELDAFNADLPALREFVLPGGNRSAAACHLARAVCRRGERRSWAASKQGKVGLDLLKYLNRLSDLLFVLARRLAREHGDKEMLWQPQRPSNGPAE
jgi:cob(I)alamin adenosyltransferase